MNKYPILAKIFKTVKIATGNKTGIIKGGEHESYKAEKLHSLQQQKGKAR